MNWASKLLDDPSWEKYLADQKAGIFEKCLETDMREAIQL